MKRKLKTEAQLSCRKTRQLHLFSTPVFVDWRHVYTAVLVWIRDSAFSLLRFKIQQLALIVFSSARVPKRRWFAWIFAFCIPHLNTMKTQPFPAFSWVEVGCSSANTAFSSSPPPPPCHLCWAGSCRWSPLLFIIPWFLSLFAFYFSDHASSSSCSRDVTRICPWPSSL